MIRLLSCLLLVLLVGCAQQPVKDAGLYHALGERPGLQRIVEGMLLNVARDERIVQRFRRVDIERLRDKLVEYLCLETGGPCHYTGDPLVEAHKGQNLTRSDFNALVENLIASMDAQNIPVTTQNRLIARLAPKRGEVIGK